MKTSRQLKIILLLLLTAFLGTVEAQNYNVTFRVDMSQYVGLNDTVYVNGTWNNWCGRCNPLVKQGTTDVWVGTFPIPTGAQEFKYTIGGWNAQETLPQGSCTVTNGGFTNRSINVTGVLDIPVVCWQSCTACTNQTQVNLPVRFDSTNVNYNLADFGGNSSIIGNDPVASGNKVAIITKTNTAETWAGTTIGGTTGFSNPIPFAQGSTKMTMRVYSPDSGVVIRLKAEESNDPTKSVETNAMTTAANTWQNLEFDFANQASGTAAINFGYVYQKLSVFCNFGITGASAGTKVYYIDDILFVTGGPVMNQVRLPINFDSTNVNYVFTDFGGNATVLDTDPLNSSNKVAKTTKSNTAETWAGTTMSNSAGLAQAIPFAQGSTTIRVSVYSPDSGIVVKLKAEDPNDPTKSVETDTYTTTKNAWEVMTFNFANHSSGTAPINYAYNYKMLSIFFNFGVNGSSAGTKTYLWDNVVFGGGTPPPPPAKVNVTFRVDTKNLPLGPTDTVTLNGTFNNWCGACTKMTNLPGTKIWQTTVALDTAMEYEYKFTVGNWDQQESLNASLPCTKTTGNFTNRVYTSRKTNDSLPLVCWESCATCPPSGDPTKTYVTFRVDMEKYTLAPTDTVTLNGTFNNWCGVCTPMRKIPSTNIWTATMLLDKDSTYQYKYVVGNWVAQEILKEGLPCTQTESGFTNRKLTVNTINDTLPVVCWESCTDCNSTAPKAKVSFKVNMKNYVGDKSAGVTLNGEFNGWCGNCTVMKDIGNDIYEVILTLDTGVYEFKYTIGNWDDQEQFSPADPCTKTTGNFTNRIITVANANPMEVGPYCWNTCTICNAVGISEAALNNIKLYPNPASDVLYVDLGTQALKVNRVSVINLMGQTINSIQNPEVLSGSNLLNINTQQLKTGIYLLQVETDNAVNSFRFTVK